MPISKKSTPTMEFKVDGLPVTVTFEDITPAYADALLKLNTHNRNPKFTSQERMVSDLSTGAWQFNGSTICISENNVLLDGQNRLQAISTAGVTVPMLIVRGLADHAQDDMDTGSKRQFADVLALRGETNTHALASIVRKVGAWEAGERRSLIQWNASNSHLLAVLDTHPELREMVNPTRTLSQSLGTPASITGLCVWLFTTIDEEDAVFFFDRLRDGQGLVKGDPVFELRRTFANDRVAGGNQQTQKQLVFLIKAWNAYRRGEQVGAYRWKPGGAKPESFPEPV